jgi:hypothetical protein
VRRRADDSSGAQGELTHTSLPAATTQGATAVHPPSLKCIEWYVQVLVVKCEVRKFQQLSVRGRQSKIVHVAILVLHAEQSYNRSG